MTNKIKPFCVNVQDIDGEGTVATEQQIRDLHKMCIDIGAVEDESIEIFLKDMYTYNYKGVSKCGETYSSDGLALFEHNLFTLQEVEAYLTPTLEDDTLVEGTLEHAYVTLKGDLNNSLNGNNDNNFVLFGKNLTMEDGYYTGLREVDDHKWNTVCTVKKFETYCKVKNIPNSSVNSHLSDDNSPEDESPIESVKPLKWTVCAQEQGIPLQVGMTCVDRFNDASVTVDYLGKSLAVVTEIVTGEERETQLINLEPFPKELTPKEEQREKVLNYLMKRKGIGCTGSLIIYDDLSKLGVFKL